MGVISPYTGDPLNVLVAAPVASPQILATGARGPKGPKGDPFRVNAQGPTSELSLYANEENGFSFLAVDSGLLYLRAGETHGVWTDPVVFGGPQGIPGESGRGINGAALSAGHLVLSYSDGQEDDLGNVQGPAGPTGPTGPAGRNITAAAIDGSGRLILSLSDASVLDVGLVVGESGSWGSITGLLSNQADLAEALNNKVTVEAGKGLSTEDYSSAEKTKLATIATNAELRDRSTHTGTQAASTISDLAAAVRGVVMTGISFATVTAGLATDSLLVFLGKLQAQINGLATALSGKQDALVSGTNIKTVNGTSLIGSGNLVIAGGGGAVGLSQYPAATVPAAGAAGGGVLVTDKGLLLYDNGAAYSAYGPIERLYSPPITGWSWVNQGAAAVVSSDFDQVISGGGSGTGASIRGRFQAIPGGAYTLTACLQITMLAKTFQSGGVALRDSVSGKLIVCALLSGASGTQNIQYAKFNSPTSFFADYIAPSVSVGGKVWLRIVDNGTNRITLFSVDGINFLEIYTVGRTDFMTPNEIGFVMSTENSATPHLAPIVRLISWQIA